MSEQKDAKKTDKPKLKPRRVLANVLFTLKYAFLFMPVAFPVGLVIAIFWGAISSAFNLFLIKYVIDSISKQTRLREALLLIGVLLVVDLVMTVGSNLFYEFVWPISVNKFLYRLQRMLYEKAVDMDLACYDNPAFYNDYVLAIGTIEEKMLEITGQIRSLFGTFGSLSTVIVIVSTINPLYLLFPAMGATATFFVSTWQNKLNFSYDMERKKLERRRDYFGRVFYLPDYAKELRLTTVGTTLLDRFNDSVSALKKLVRERGRKIMLARFLQDFVVGDFLTNFCVAAFSVYNILVLKIMSIGNTVVVLNSTGNITWQVSSIITSVTKFQENALHIENLRKFLEYQPTIISGTLQAPDRPAKLELRHVTFTYDGAEKPVIEDLNLTIAPGEKLAFVGYNGAGKTTLIKLLLRLYDVTGGEILLDGVNIKQYELRSYRDYFGTVFQDFAIFAATLAENVTCEKIENEEQKQPVRRALELSGFEDRLKELEAGLDTLLTKEFDSKGTNLSGGENQKVAVARVFVRPVQCAVLDEPSSSLDPISEYNLNQSMTEAAQGKTIVFISHRLSTTRMADRICMMENGKIIESGSHDELMSIENGKYAEMFHTQAAKYISQA